MTQPHPIRLPPILSVGIVAILLASTAAGADFDPHKIPRDEFRRRVRTIALRPLFIPPEIENADTVRVRFEALITAALQRKGYTVIASRELEQTWQQLSEKTGGVYDPITGKPDEKKLETVKNYTARELAQRHKVNAVVASYISLNAVLPGVSPWTGRIDLWGDPITFNGGTVAAMPQRVVAAILNVAIYDTDWVELYEMWAGIEWVKVFILRGYDVKPTGRAYNDDNRNQHAIDLIFDPLVASDGQ